MIIRLTVLFGCVGEQHIFEPFVGGTARGTPDLGEMWVVVVLRKRRNHAIGTPILRIIRTNG